MFLRLKRLTVFFLQCFMAEDKKENKNSEGGEYHIYSTK